MKLEFAGRVQLFSDALAATLPASRSKAIKILEKSLPPALPDCEDVTDGWLQWPIGQFIADHGLPHFEISMKTMTALTKRFSSEFAVRPFVDQYPKETFAYLRKLTADKDPHVRRWCSEGIRPRLPWGKVLRDLVEDPAPIWPILEALKDDDSLYVRRSVANNLNDIAKDHPDLVIKRCKAWSKNSNPQRDWLIKHALRTLIKAGDTRALALVGYKKPKAISTKLQLSPKKIALGQSVAMQATISSKAPRAQALMIDYVVHYVRQRNQTSEKVFKWKTLTLESGQSLVLDKKHPMRTTTIRALYPGAHRVELQINGQRLASGRFELI